uniref:Uncharacterized protein n=1 Tax=Arundo donax TaxID=35708 RepID=A0A0A9D267_ARUDO
MADSCNPFSTVTNASLNPNTTFRFACTVSVFAPISRNLLLNPNNSPIFPSFSSELPFSTSSPFFNISSNCLPLSRNLSNTPALTLFIITRSDGFSNTAKNGANSASIACKLTGSIGKSSSRNASATWCPRPREEPVMMLSASGSRALSDRMDVIWEVMSWVKELALRRRNAWWRNRQLRR